MTHDELLAKAVADRDERPWNYYKLDHETMKRMLNQMADKLAALRQAAAQARKVAQITFCDKCGDEWVDNGIATTKCPHCTASAQARVIAEMREMFPRELLYAAQQVSDTRWGGGYGAAVINMRAFLTRLLAAHHLSASSPQEPTP